MRSPLLLLLFFYFFFFFFFFFFFKFKVKVTLHCLIRVRIRVVTKAGSVIRDISCGSSIWLVNLFDVILTLYISQKYFWRERDSNLSNAYPCNGRLEALPLRHSVLLVAGKLRVLIRWSKGARNHASINQFSSNASAKAYPNGSCSNFLLDISRIYSCLKEESELNKVAPKSRF